MDALVSDDPREYTYRELGDMSTEHFKKLREGVLRLGEEWAKVGERMGRTLSEVGEGLTKKVVPPLLGVPPIMPRSIGERHIGEEPPGEGWVHIGKTENGDPVFLRTDSPMAELIRDGRSWRVNNEYVIEQDKDGVAILTCPCAEWDSRSEWCRHCHEVVTDRRDGEGEFVASRVQVPIGSWRDPAVAGPMEHTIVGVIGPDHLSRHVMFKVMNASLPERIGYEVKRVPGNSMAEVNLGLAMPGDGRDDLRNLLFEFIDYAYPLVPRCRGAAHHSRKFTDAAHLFDKGKRQRRPDFSTSAGVPLEVRIHVLSILRIGLCAYCRDAEASSDDLVIPDI